MIGDHDCPTLVISEETDSLSRRIVLDKLCGIDFFRVSLIKYTYLGEGGILYCKSCLVFIQLCLGNNC